jgi:hypothetical protein
MADGKGIVILPSKDKEQESLFGNTIKMKDLLSTQPSTDSLGDVGHLYDFVSDPQVHIKDKVNALLKLHMFFSKEILTSETIEWEAVQIYRVRKEAVADLKKLVELLNEYSSVDNFDTEHPLYSKSLNFIMEAILTEVKENTENSQFDNIVRGVAIALPTIESRIKNIIADSTTEDILAMRENPLMDALNSEKDMFKEYLLNRDMFLEYMRGVSDENA